MGLLLSSGQRHSSIELKMATTKNKLKSHSTLKNKREPGGTYTFLAQMKNIWTLVDLFVVKQLKLPCGQSVYAQACMFL